jgi:hypothetical protein
MRPELKKLADRGYPIKSVDVDRSPKLAARYQVESVPTFVVVDSSGREIDRTMGFQPAAQLGKFYVAARDRAAPPANSNAHLVGDTGTASDDADVDPDANIEEDPSVLADEATDQPAVDGEESAPVAVNPKAWETVVRIRIQSRGSIGFGSGTIIHSTPEESLILTCAHVFKMEGQRPVPPSQFPLPITIDLFDGNLRGVRPAQVRYAESVPGEAVDYDFTHDVGLIRIKPGRRLPAARVVPPHWQPLERMKMLTVGCSEGQDATAWHTVILNPRMRGLSGNASYEAIECQFAPKQGRSGGGLFTTDGYVAGVCNFAEPRGDHGLYATPRSIYALLDRNRLMALYAPVDRPGTSPTLVADRGSNGRARSRPAANRRSVEPETIARAQSPDREDAAPSRTRVAAAGELTIPRPELLGIRVPRGTATAGSRTSGAGGDGSNAPATGRRVAWQPRPASPNTLANSNPTALADASHPSIDADEAEPTDLDLDPQADLDSFHDLSDSADEQEPAQAANSSGSNGRAANPSRTHRTNSNSSSWRAVRPSATGAATESVAGSR